MFFSSSSVGARTNRTELLKVIATAIDYFNNGVLCVVAVVVVRVRVCVCVGGDLIFSDPSDRSRYELEGPAVTCVYLTV